MIDENLSLFSFAWLKPSLFTFFLSFSLSQSVYFILPLSLYFSVEVYKLRLQPSLPFSLVIPFLHFSPSRIPPCIHSLLVGGSFYPHFFGQSLFPLVFITPLFLLFPMRLELEWKCCSNICRNRSVFH